MTEPFKNAVRWVVFFWTKNITFPEAGSLTLSSSFLKELTLASTQPDIPLQNREFELDFHSFFTIFFWSKKWILAGC